MPSNALIFSAMLTVAAALGEVDLITLKNELHASGKLESVGGAGYIASLVEGVPDIANVERYAKIIQEKAQARKLIRLFASSAQKLSGGAQAKAVGSEVAGEIADLDLVADSKASYDALTISRSALERFEQRLADPNAVTGIPTGYESLDLYFYGYQRGTVLVIGSRPSVGKTTMAWNCVVRALRASPETRVWYGSLEMTRQMLEDRILAMMSGVKSSWIKTGTLIRQDQVRAVGDAAAELGRWDKRLYTNANPLTVREMLAEIRRVHRKSGLDVAFIDYLQLVESDSRGRSREEDVSRISKKLLNLAKELDIAIVAMSQLNRVGQGKEERPTADNMRESDAIFHDARSLIILDRPRLRDRDNENKRYCDLRLHVDKNSEGPLGEIQMHYDGDRFLIEEGGCPPECRFYGQEAA